MPRRAAPGTGRELPAAGHESGFPSLAEPDASRRHRPGNKTALAAPSDGKVTEMEGMHDHDQEPGVSSTLETSRESVSQRGAPGLVVQSKSKNMTGRHTN